MAKAATKRSVRTQSNSGSKLTGTEAIEHAKSHLRTFIEENDLVVEEAEVDDYFWWITFSMPDRSNSNLKILPLVPRKFKTVKIKADTGEFVSMSVRDIYGKK